MSENFERIVLEKLNKIDGRLDKIDDRLDNFDGKLGNFDGRLGSLEIELKDTQEIVILNRNTLLKMEQRDHDNFGALFDSFSANNDNHKDFSKSIKNLQNSSFEHDIRISILEDSLKQIKEA